MRVVSDPRFGDVLEGDFEGLPVKVPRVLLGRYELERPMAAGGFGVLFIGRDRWLFGKRVVIKTNRYDPQYFRHENDVGLEKRVEEQRGRLDFERRVLLRAGYRGISGVPVLLDWIESPSPQLRGPHLGDDGVSFELTELVYGREPFLVLQLIAGKTLKEQALQKKFRDQRLGRAKQLIREIGGVLCAFHQFREQQGQQVGFVYQDLKPDNIMVTPDGSFVLIDFGSFALRTPSDVFPFNALVSTPPYRAPEFDRALPLSEQVTPAADVYSLGMTVLYLLRGSEPSFPDTGLPDRSTNSLALPADWITWINRAVADTPKQRFTSMEEAVAESFRLTARFTQ